MEIKMVSNLLQVNDSIAQHNRALFKKHNIKVVNIMSSPGAGKTTLLEKTLERLVDRYRIAVIEGDVASDEDSRRLSEFPIQVAQINTINLGGVCHLDANMVASALQHFELERIQLLFIENVGNLICPSGFDLGEHQRVVILSIPEGHDKPRKYPIIFRKTSVVLLSKIDLIDRLDYDKKQLYDDLNNIKVDLKIFELSALTGEGMSDWISWLENLIAVDKNT